MKVLLFLLSAVVLSVQADPRLGFCVGTSQRTCDIIKDGVTQGDWKNGVMFQPQEVSSGTFQFNWYIFLNATGLPNTQAYNQTYDAGYSAVYTLNGTGNLWDTIATSTYPDVTTWTMTCLQEAGPQYGFSYVTFILPGYDEAIVHWTHLCQHPDTLNIGLEKASVGPNSPMLDGEVKPGYTFTSNSGEVFTHYYAWLSNTNKPPQQYQINAVVHPNPMTLGADQLKVDMTYTNGNVASVIVGNEPVSGFQLFWECPTNIPGGTASWKVDVQVNYGFKTVPFFTLNKMCGKPPNPRLGLEIGLEKNGTEIADGGVSKQWNMTVPKAFIVGDVTQSLWVWLDSSKTFDDSQTFWVEVDLADPTILTVGIQGAKGIAYQPNGGTEKDAIVTFTFFCLKPGYTTGIIMFKLDQDWDPITLYVNKNCSAPVLNMGVMQGDAIGDANIIKGGILSGNKFEESTSHMSTRFDFWVPSEWAQSVSPYQQIVITGLSNDLGTAKLSLPNGDKARGQHNPGAPAYVQVNYGCVSPPPTSTIHLNMTINVGWENSYTISWVKHCGPTGGGGSAWSPFGIFAFTVFILILLWCLIGCAYNYVAKDQRGADAIPGINLYRSCYQRCFPAPRYTPQTDYNYDKAPDYGGTTYQSENL